MQAEEDLFLWRESCGYGRVERVHDGRSELEMANDDVGEFVVERGLCG
jgi:hypothetical protein